MCAFSGRKQRLRAIQKARQIEARELVLNQHRGNRAPRRTTHLRSSSQEVCDGHEGLFAAKANNGERFFLRLSTYLTALDGVRVCQPREMIRIHVHAKALTAA